MIPTLVSVAIDAIYVFKCYVARDCRRIRICNKDQHGIIFMSFQFVCFVSPIVILTAPLFLLKLIITSPLPCVCTAERPSRARAESDWNKSSGVRSAYSANTVHVASATSESRPTTTTGSPRFPPLSPTYKTYQMLTPLYLERVTIDQPK